MDSYMNGYVCEKSEKFKKLVNPKRRIPPIKSWVVELYNNAKLRYVPPYSIRRDG